MHQKANSIEEYFSWQSEENRVKLASIRRVILEEVPEAKEVISYHMPAIRTSEVLVYYAIAKKHVGFYPTNQPILHFQEELIPYKTSKGAIQFPLHGPLPLDLIRKITKYRHELVTAKSKSKN